MNTLSQTAKESLMGILDGKVALVTGGGTLFGRAVVAELHRAGARVAVWDIDDTGGNASVSHLGANGAFFNIDVTQDEAVCNGIESVVKTFGSLDVLVNLACSYNDAGAESTREQWLSTLNVNLISAAIVADCARPHLKKSGKGAIINLSSISSKVAQTGRWVYPVSKAGLVQLTRNMAMDYAADGIRVNSVSPGWTWSAIMDMLSKGDRKKTDKVAAPFHFTGRVGDPEEVGRVIAFLASDQASIVTGADWAADGGYSAMGPEQAVPAIPLLEA